MVCGSGRARVSSRGEEAQLLVSLGQNLETLKAQVLFCASQVPWRSSQERGKQVRVGEGGM